MKTVYSDLLKKD